MFPGVRLEMEESEDKCAIKEPVISIEVDSQFDSQLDLNKICTCCLSATKLRRMDNVTIDTVTCVTFYQSLSMLEVSAKLGPRMICESCIETLRKINEYVTILKRSYNILENATQLIEELDIQPDIERNMYNTQKINIIQSVLKQKVLNPILHCEFASKVEKNIESAEDDLPLSKLMPSQKTLRGRKYKLNKSNLPPKKLRQKNKENTELSTRNIETSNQVCPVCSKRVSSVSRHLQLFHFISWDESKCLKCLYQNIDKCNLLEHCSKCTKKELDNDDYDEGANDMFDNSTCDERDELNEKSELGENMENDMGYDGDSSSCITKKRTRGTKLLCNLCQLPFEKYIEIEAHLKAVHAEESRCILCDKEFTNSFTLLYHMMVKHGKLKCCRLCLLSFQSTKELSNHYKSEEHNTKCTVCGEQFRNRKALYEHRRKKHLNPQQENQKYKCPECTKEFANQNNIKRHIMVAHNDQRFLCDTCGQSYTTKRNLRLHIQKFHEGVEVVKKNTKKNFFCEACGRELKIFHKYAIAMHRAKHIGHHFVCKKCYDTFECEQDFKKHIDDSGHQLFECDKCKAEFVREENFKIHLKNHEAPGWNKNMFATWGKSAKLRNEKGEFVCSYCPKVFKDKQRLDNHVRVHTNERPYKCYICSKSFKTWIHRKTHMNIHLGIKKWVCKYCSKAFTNSCTLKGHEMLHTGERPHCCTECRKGFITLSAMKKHRMVHFRKSGGGGGNEARVDLKSEILDKSEFALKCEHTSMGSDETYATFTETDPKVTTIPIMKIDKAS